MIKNVQFYLKVTGAVFAAIFLIFLITGGVIYARTTQLPVLVPTSADGDIYQGDVTIEEGEIHAGDVILYSGDLRIKSEGVIEGNLLVYSGDVTVEEYATVAGDVVSWSGDVHIAGHVQGDLVAWSGDIDLKESAVVEGDVSVMSGDIHRDRGAIIAGNLVAGPKLPELPEMMKGFVWEAPPLPGATSVAGAVQPAVRSETMDGFVRLVLRMLAAALLTALVVFITGLVYYLQPTFIGRIRATLTTQRPVSFIIGLLINLLLTMSMLLVLSSKSFLLAVCLAPVSLLGLLLFFILNTGGWAALSQIVGARLLAFVNMPNVQPLVTVLTGATAMTGALALVWALGSCMQPVAYLAMLALTSLGGGALIVQQFNRRHDRGSDAGSDQGNGGAGDNYGDDQPVLI